jgi:hypothetical protein
MRTRIAPAALSWRFRTGRPGSIGTTSRVFRRGVVRNFPFAFSPGHPTRRHTRRTLLAFVLPSRVLLVS